MPGIELINRAAFHKNNIAIISDKKSYSYSSLVKSSNAIAYHLLNRKEDLNGARVAFLIEPSYDYVATLWGIWQAGAVAVPLGISHPQAELEYSISDCDAEFLISDQKNLHKILPIANTQKLNYSVTDCLLSSQQPSQSYKLPDIDSARNAMILYTSGSTGKPKGVVITHNNIEAQVTTLVEAWGWTDQDHILNTLPLHHVHGIINAMACAFWSGAKCEIHSKFDPNSVWERLKTGDLSLFMAVPTTYKSLINEWETKPIKEQSLMSLGASKLRLMVSGSDALLATTMKQWEDITGHTLLERYGMTEVGMALSNPLEGIRNPGHVGTPLPNVKIRLVSLSINEKTGLHEHGEIVPAGEPGEIQIKGPSVFKEYWKNPPATKEAFSEDGWFCSGDVASLNEQGYRIWGRASQDIIITGGENVSAKEVEQILSEHPNIIGCAVVGIDDPYWGNAVSVAIVANKKISREDLRSWAKNKMAPYKVPQKVRLVDILPLNSMGKVIKPEVRKLFR